MKFVGFLIVLLQIFAEASIPPISVKMKINNHAGGPINIYWLSPSRAEYLQNDKPIRNSSSHVIDSYKSHQFVIKFAPSRNHTKLDSRAVFTKGERDEAVNVYFNTSTKQFKIHQLDTLDDLLAEVNQASQICGSHQGEKFTSCLGEHIFPTVDRLKQTNKNAITYRLKMGERLRAYTCADKSMNTSKSIISFDYTHQGTSFKIDTLLYMPNAKIWYAHDLITEKECNILKEYSRPRLVRANIVATDGTQEISSNRKAYHADRPLRTDNTETDVLWPLYKRVMDFTNTIGRHSIQPEGQEGFSIIKYGPSDEYTPHCDADCFGEKHRPGGRVATALLYCTVPPKGGGTTFSHADVFVKPKKYDAVLFSYKGTDGYMDDGLTTHSGCPVLEGEKWVTTIWMREGVSKERNWAMIDPSGLEVLM